MLTDIEIAQQAKMKNITEIAKKIGIAENEIDPYGHYKAKINDEALESLKETCVFGAVSGVLVGKPMDETYAEEYKQLLVKVIDRPELPIVFNVNIGHAMPRCIMPFGVEAVVDVNNQVIRFAD